MGVLGSILLAPMRCMTLCERTIGKEYFLNPAHADNLRGAHGDAP